MPWMETCVVEQRNAFVHDVLRGEACKAELCRRYGISRPTGDRWLARFEQLGVTGLVDRSSVPHHHPHRLSEELAAMIVALRRKHPRWGPRKLRAYLVRQQPRVSWPAASTIGELLGREGLIRPRKVRRRTPPYTQPFLGYDEPNDVWCADFKGWFTTGDGRKCHPLTITDGCSRYLLDCRALSDQRGERARKVFERVFRIYGLPRAIRSDNGSPFASRGVGGLSALSIWWLKLGILPERIEPGKPQQNGRHERMHLTLKQETASPPASCRRSQQACFDRFRAEYNDQRPHEALGQRPPASAYRRSGRSYGRKPPAVEYPSEMAVRKVQSTGTILWRRRRLYLGEALAGEPVGVLGLEDGSHLIYFCNLAVGVLDERRKKIWPLERAARLGLVDRWLVQRPFRCAPGPLHEPNM